MKHCCKKLTQFKQHDSIINRNINFLFYSKETSVDDF